MTGAEAITHVETLCRTLEEVARGLTLVRPDVLLTTETRLAESRDGLQRLHETVRSGELDEATRDRLVSLAVRARFALDRCRSLGGILQKFAGDVLTAQGRGGAYDRRGGAGPFVRMRGALEVRG